MTTKVPVKLLDTKVITDVTFSNGALTFTFSDGTTAAGSSIPKPKYKEYFNITGVGPYDTPGSGGENTSGSFASLQVFVNGVLQIQDQNYTVVVNAGGTGNISLINPPQTAFDLVIYEF